MSSNYYDILGVPANASKGDIKKAYRKLARIYHPDVKETGNEEKFKEINNAYQFLTDFRNKGGYGESAPPPPKKKQDIPQWVANVKHLLFDDVIPNSKAYRTIEFQNNGDLVSIKQVVTKNVPIGLMHMLL